MKLIIKDSINMASENVYEKFELLGHVLYLASNDIHTIHINATGPQFQELHSVADTLRIRLFELVDACFEIASENDVIVKNNSSSLDYVPNWVPVTNEKYYFNQGIYKIQEIIKNVVNNMVQLRELPSITSDLVSELDTWIRELTKEVNYFLNRKLKNKDITVLNKKESMMTKFVIKNRKSQRGFVQESLDTLEVGKSYLNFNLIADHIEEYDVDLTSLKQGDIIVKLFQSGYEPHGNNKGYIPVQIVEPYNGTFIVIDNNKYLFKIWVDQLCKWETYHKLKKASF